MGETGGQSVRSAVRLVGIGSALVLVTAMLANGCAETRVPDGAACMKSVDCLSGICSEGVCAAPSPTISTMINNPDASTTAETGPSEASPSEAASEASAPEGGSSEGGEGGSPEAAAD